MSMSNYVADRERLEQVGQFLVTAHSAGTEGTMAVRGLCKVVIRLSLVSIGQTYVSAEWRGVRVRRWSTYSWQRSFVDVYLALWRLARLRSRRGLVRLYLERCKS